MTQKKISNSLLSLLNLDLIKFKKTFSETEDIRVKYELHMKIEYIERVLRLIDISIQLEKMPTIKN